MSQIRYLGVLLYIYIGICIAEDGSLLQKHMTLKQGEKKISEYVVAVLEHYKQKDPIGIPGAPIPDPLEIPSFSHSFSIGKMNFKNVKLHGLTKFRIVHIRADLAAMQVDTALQIDTLHVFGNYTLSTWLSTSEGPFTIQLTNVFVKAQAKLEVQMDGRLEAQEMNMDIKFKNIAMNFERLGFFAGVFQGVINSVGTFVFDTIKPFILAEVNTNMRNDVNKQLREMPQTFPNSISPFDQLVAEARNKIRDYKYDPLKLEDYNHTAGIIGIQMTHTWLTGLSSFHRVGNMAIEVRNNTLHLIVEIGTQKLKGTTHWEVAIVGGVLSRAGTASFSVEYLKVEIALSQSMDTRNKPILNDIQLELGNIQIRCDGAGTVDYLIEFGINVIPNLLRYQIMDALELPTKQRIQEALNTINVEQMIHENLPKLDDQQQYGFQGFL